VKNVWIYYYLVLHKIYRFYYFNIKSDVANKEVRKNERKKSLS